MENGLWIGPLVVFPLIAVSVLLYLIWYYKKRKTLNCDDSMSYFYYRVARKPEEICASLAQGIYNTLIEYEYDPVENTITFYWLLTKSGVHSTFYIRFVQQETECQMILQNQKEWPINDWTNQLSAVDEMNRFWEYIAEATPIPYQSRFN